MKRHTAPGAARHGVSARVPWHGSTALTTWHIHTFQCTIGPQPELARHQGFCRLVANGVKRMLNYTNIETFFSDIVYSFRVTNPRSKNFETIAENKFRAREKYRLIDVQKLKPYILTC